MSHLNILYHLRLYAVLSKFSVGSPLNTFSDFLSCFDYFYSRLF